MDSVSNVTSMNKGGGFDGSSASRTGHAIIASMDPMIRLEIRVQMGDDQDSHVFVLQSRGGFLGLHAEECSIDYTLEPLMGGGILGDFLARGNPADAMRVNRH